MMKKYFKSRFFYIITTLALIFTIVPTVLCSMGAGFVVRDTIGVILTPAQKLFNYAAEGIEGFTAYFYKFNELAEENTRLREEVSELQTKLYDSAEIEDMYEWMSDFLELKMAHNDYEFLAATVTGRESGNYSKILTLDVGSGAGVTTGMPVITSAGIIGQVTEVGLNWCKVTSILESSSSIGAYIEKTGDAGICSGSFELASDGIVQLEYLSSDAVVNVGDRVLTTGYGSVYPRGLVVGYVTEVGKDGYSRSPSVKVQAACDLTDVSKVMIITSFEQYAN
jgi:rod shape-determining protein MreC